MIGRVSRFLRGLFRAATAEQKARRAFFAIPLAATDITIDCGANVGEVTQHLAESGATVHAFEPNPHAFAVLKERFADAENVHCHPRGVSVQDTTLKLYLHEHSDQDEVHWSTGSSILSFKDNVRTDKFVEVDIIDLVGFIGSLDRRVKILKVDIEGAECAVLTKLIDTGLIDRVDHVFVETHDHKIPELKEETDALRELVRRRGIRHINLDWT